MPFPLLFGAAFPDEDAPSPTGSDAARPADAPPGPPPGVPRHSDAPPLHDAPGGEAEPSAPALEEPPPEGPLSRDHPAYDRVQTRTEDDARRSPSAVLWAAFVLLLMGAALGITYLALRPEPAEGGVPNLLSLAAAHAGTVEMALVTDDLDAAQGFILSEFGWPVRVPVLPDARLVGVGIDEIAAGIELPVLQYQPDEGEPITVFLYDYAFLDAAAGRLELAPAVYSRLAEDDPVDVRRVGETSLVLWRRRAAIYTAVTPNDPAPLVEYLRRLG